MKKLAGLGAHFVEPNGEPGSTVVLLHGFGAPGTDLVSLSEALGGNRRYVFLEAPLVLPTPFGEGRAWWMIDPMRFQQAVLTGSFDDIERAEPSGMAEAREQLGQALDALASEIGPEPIVLGGFSQGSMLSLDLAIHDPRPLKKLVLLSCTVVSRPAWIEGLPRRRGLRVYQSHGTQDPLLPFSQAQRLRSMLEDAGLDVAWRPFEGQHEIPFPVVRELDGFLD